MSSIVRRLGLALALAAPVAAFAAGSPQVKQEMTANGCFACHAVTHKIVGPAYGWVAYHYHNNPTTIAYLARKIISGGTGYWNPWTGGVPMVPHPQLTLAQAEQMASWVMAQKPIAPPKP